jgi:hypothetical protein
MSDLFFNQKMEQKLPEKKMPSTAEKATNLSAKELVLLIHFKAKFAFLVITGTFWIALNKKLFSVASLM